MRKDENGRPCPDTLGEYRDLCFALNANSMAVQFLDEKIKETSRDEKVLATDHQMRSILFPMLVEKK